MNRTLQTLLKLSLASHFRVIGQNIQLVSSFVRIFSLNAGVALNNLTHCTSINNGKYEMALAGISEPISVATSEDTLSSILGWDGILMAVPKRKTTPSKKKMRSRHKQLKPRTDLISCKTCNKRHPMHHLCPFCYDFNRWTSGKDGGQDRHRSRKE